MFNVPDITRKLRPAFNEKQARLLAEVVVDAYTDLVKTSDFNELKAIVKDLAEEQKALAQAQRRTEQRMEELAVALRQLTDEHTETRRQLGGLATTVGYRLEDEAFKALPALLQRDFGIEVQGRLRRRFVTDNRGQPMEVNIIGDALRDQQPLVIVGESKSQLSKNKVNEFVQKKLKRLEGVFAAEVFPVLVTYMISEPDVEEYVKERGIALYYSFDFE
jgi:hypothetical protein